MCCNTCILEAKMAPSIPQTMNPEQLMIYSCCQVVDDYLCVGLISSQVHAVESTVTHPKNFRLLRRVRIAGSGGVVTNRPASVGGPLLPLSNDQYAIFAPDVGAVTAEVLAWVPATFQQAAVHFASKKSSIFILPYFLD